METRDWSADPTGYSVIMMRYTDCLISWHLRRHHRLRWRLVRVVKVPGVGTVSLVRSDGDGLRLMPEEQLTLGWRQGGERCCLPGRAGSRSLKGLNAGVESASLVARPSAFCFIWGTS